MPVPCPRSSGQSAQAGLQKRTRSSAAHSLIELARRTAPRRSEADLLGDVARQVGQPLARPARMLGDIVQPLGREGVGADQEAVGEFEERLAPAASPCRRGVRGAGRRDRTTGSRACAAWRHVLRPRETRMRPQHARAGILREVALDRVGIGMRVQEQPVLLGELHDAPHVGQVGVGAVDVEFADRHVLALRQRSSMNGITVGSFAQVPSSPRER